MIELSQIIALVIFGVAAIIIGKVHRVIPALIGAALTIVVVSSSLEVLENAFRNHLLASNRAKMSLSRSSMRLSVLAIKNLMQRWLVL